MTNEKPITSDTELTEEWERIYRLPDKKLKAELRKLGVQESDLQSGYRKFIKRLDEEIARSTPKLHYKM
jgi:hypothetical protein